MPAAQLFFDDLVVGDRFHGPSRTITESHYLLFSAVSSDTHPVHYDKELAARHRFKRPVAHGLLLVAFTALGATDLSPRIVDSMIAFLDQGTSFSAPAFVGDTIYPVSEVSELVAKGDDKGIVSFAISLTNQRGELLLSGLQRYLMHRRNGI